jgi:hypothetical protein
MYAAHELNGPNFAHAIVMTGELLAGLKRDPYNASPRPR